MNYTASNIAKAVKGMQLQSAAEPNIIRYLLSDSRQIISASGSVFIALKGSRYDGHKFLQEAYKSGVRCFIISDKKSATGLVNADIILVENTLNALQKLASYHRNHFTYPVVGITGSNGKTVVKEWLFQLLRKDYFIVRSPKSYNSQIGVPLSVLEMKKAHDLAIFEAGISQKSEMVRLEKIIRPTIGILTNIGAAHDEGFTSRQEKMTEKAQLFTGAKILICEYKNAVILQKTAPQQLPETVLTWGREKEADLCISRIIKKEETTQIWAIYEKKKINFTLPFQDSASIENALHCCLTLLSLGIDNQTIAHRIKNLEQVAMRLELKQGSDSSLIINDSYNSDLSSLRIALRFLEQQSKNLAKVVILSDILQSGKASNKLYQSVATLLKKYQIKRVVGIGKEVQILKEFLPNEVEYDFYLSTDNFLHQLRSGDFSHTAILLKGARRFYFEKIAARLEQKTHNTILEVNLSALLHNLRVYRSYLRPETKLLVMVKASAYGSGSLETAKLLEYQKIDYFGVAYADEGVELRKSGIKTPILVLNPEAATFPQLIEHDLEPEVYSLKQLRELIHFIKNRNEKIGIHLKLETGMNRLGFEYENLAELGKLLNQQPSIKVISVFSHLSGSEASQHDGFSEKQINIFEKHYNIICSSIGYRPFRHILNSSGINRFSDYQMDMVRLGIGIYGVDSSAEISAKLQVVNTLKARISQIKNLKEGDTVGYGRTGKITKATRTATVSIGYADGLRRAAGQGNYTLTLHGKRAPIIGNICMDMCMIDISQIPEAKEGDEVIVFGENPSVQELAEVFGTIPYEVFTNISKRVKRVYFEL